MRTCKIEGCNKKHKGYGYCNTHYQRFKRHGDPLKYKLHRMSHLPEYSIWYDMKRRCYNKNNKRYACYGGRGIIVCDKWIHDFKAFYEDMGEKPFPKAQIDRIDNDGNYEPDNCKWVTNEYNCQHTSRVKLSKEKVIKIRQLYNKNIPQIEISKMFNVHRTTICDVVHNRHWKNI